MLFNSFSYIVFFVVVTALYFVFPHKLRWIILLAASYIFYMAWKPELIVLIVFSTFSNYAISRKIYASEDAKKRKKLLVLSLVINFGLLFIFKYLVFLNETFIGIFDFGGGKWPIESFDIILPMGISFYTFQAASYTIDVYKGVIKPVKNYGKFSLFITFFPQLVAGPIARNKNLLPQFYKKHRFDVERAVMGVKIMIWGFFKKVVIADRAAVAVNTVFNSAQYYSGLTLVFAAILFSFQLYCDFSGYSDIAIGSAKVLGFDLMRNFERPFLSGGIREFWKRWHISLSSWFMDYVYIPLGGNRCSRLKKYRNLFVTFLVSGLWHGANWTFVAWGALHGAMIVAEDITKGVFGAVKKFFGAEKHGLAKFVFRFVGIVFTFGFAVFAFIFFRANTIGDALYIVRHLLWGFRSWTDAQYIYSAVVNLGIGMYEIKTLVLAILTLAATEIFGGKDIHKSLKRHGFLFRLAFYSYITVFILTAGVFYNAGEFIYFQF